MSVFARNVISNVSLRSEYETISKQWDRGLQKCKKKKILFIIFAQNIECGYAIPRKISFARHSLTVSKTEYLIASEILAQNRRRA